jgi:hypothetical protein
MATTAESQLDYTRATCDRAKVCLGSSVRCRDMGRSLLC